MSAEANARVLSAFLDYLKVEKGLAPLTVSAYTTDICQFAEFLEERNRMLDDCATHRMCAILSSNYFRMVSMGAQWDGSFRHCGICTGTLLVDGKIDHDPTLNIDSPKQWKVLPKALARDEMEKTLAAPQAASDSKLAHAIAVAGSGDAGSFLCGGAAGIGNCSSKA